MCPKSSMIIVKRKESKDNLVQPIHHNKMSVID